MIWPLLPYLVYVMHSDWWSGLLQHSIFNPEWWESVLQGSVGNFLSLIGLFLVFWLTRHHELDRDHRARQAEQKVESERRTAESVASFQAVCFEIMATDWDMRRNDPASKNLVVQLFNALATFSVRESADYPKVTTWISDQKNELTPWLNHEHGEYAAQIAAGSLSGALAGWVRGGHQDDHEFLTDETTSILWENVRQRVEVFANPPQAPNRSLWGMMGFIRKKFADTITPEKKMQQTVFSERGNEHPNSEPK